MQTGQRLKVGVDLLTLVVPERSLKIGTKTAPAMLKLKWPLLSGNQTHLFKAAAQTDPSIKAVDKM